MKWLNWDKWTTPHHTTILTWQWIYPSAVHPDNDGFAAMHVWQIGAVCPKIIVRNKWANLNQSRYKAKLNTFRKKNNTSTCFQSRASKLEIIIFCFPWCSLYLYNLGFKQFLIAFVHFSSGWCLKPNPPVQVPQLVLLCRNRWTNPGLFA